MPAVFSLRGMLSWHLSRWLHITSVPARFPGYVHLSANLPPEGGFPWEPADHREMVEKYLKGELSHVSWSALDAEGYWFFTQRINAAGVFNAHLGWRPEWPTIGFYTMRILLMIHRNPERLFRLSEPALEEYFESGRWRRDICRGWGLRQEHLKEDACRVLEGELGYRREDLERALALMPEEVNVAEQARKERAERELRGNEALCDEILHAERLVHRYIAPALTGAEPAPPDRRSSPMDGPPPPDSCSQALPDRNRP